MLVIKDKFTIDNYCKAHNIELKDFNEPVKIADNITDCSYMFKNCESFNQKVIIPDSVINCDYMFKNCKSLNKQFVIPSTVKTFIGMFDGCINQKRTVHVSKNLIFSFKNCPLKLNSVSLVYVGESDAEIYCESNDETYCFKKSILTVYSKDGVKDFCKDNLIGYLYFNYPVIISESVTDISGMLKDMHLFQHDIIIPMKVVKDDNFLHDGYHGTIIDSRKLSEVS